MTFEIIRVVEMDRSNGLKGVMRSILPKCKKELHFVYKLRLYEISEET
jgi:hypothetical protein